VFVTPVQPDASIGCPLHGTGLGLIVTSSRPGPLGVVGDGDGDGAGEGLGDDGPGTSVGDVGEGSTLPQAAAVNAVTQTATSEHVRSLLLKLIAMGSPERQNTSHILRGLYGQQIAVPSTVG
jgi:hypothetical protein